MCVRNLQPCFYILIYKEECRNGSRCGNNVLHKGKTLAWAGGEGGGRVKLRGGAGGVRAGLEGRAEGNLNGRRGACAGLQGKREGFR